MRDQALMICYFESQIIKSMKLGIIIKFEVEKRLSTCHIFGLKLSSPSKQVFNSVPHEV